MSRLVRQFLDRNGQSPPAARPRPTPADPPGQSRGLLDWLRKAAGGWLGPRLSKGTPVGREVEREKMASGPRRIVIPWFLPYHDEQTRETPAQRLAYRWMLSDGTVKSAVLGQIRAVARRKLKVRPANKRFKKDRQTAAFVEWNLTERLADGMPGLIWSVLIGGLVDGFSVSEKVFGVEDKGRYAGKWPLMHLKPKDVNLDLVPQVDEFRNVVGLMGLRYNGGYEFSAADFLIYRHLPLFDAPTGMSALRAAYQPWWMLDTVRKFRMVHAEKRAMPFAIGTYTTADQQLLLNQALGAIKAQNWVSVPDTVKVDVLDMAGAAADVYDSFCKYLKHEIFLAISDASLQAIEGTVSDARGDSSVHESRAEEAIDYLAATVVAVLNDRDRGLVRDVVDLNEVVSEYPRVGLESVDSAELRQQADLDKVLLDTGLRLSKDEAYERYERVPPKTPEDDWKKEEPGGGAPPGLPFGEGPRAWAEFGERFERFCMEGDNAGKPGPCPGPTAGVGAPRPATGGPVRVFKSYDDGDRWGIETYGGAAWADRLTPEQDRAVKNYVTTSERFNNVLRGRNTDPDAVAATERLAPALDAALAVKPLPEPVQLWRGVKDVPGVSWRAGEEWTDPGYFSTSVNAAESRAHADPAEYKGRALPGAAMIRVRAPAGTPGAYLGAHPGGSSEQEFLLGRGLTYRVTAVHEPGTPGHPGKAYGMGGGDYRVVDLEVVPPGSVAEEAPAKHRERFLCFFEEKKDKRGRRYCVEEGRGRVPCPPAAGAAGAKPAAAKKPKADPAARAKAAAGKKAAAADKARDEHAAHEAAHDAAAKAHQEAHERHQEAQDEVRQRQWVLDDAQEDLADAQAAQKAAGRKATPELKAATLAARTAVARAKLALAPAKKAEKALATEKGKALRAVNSSRGKAEKAKQKLESLSIPAAAAAPEPLDTPGADVKSDVPTKGKFKSLKKLGGSTGALLVEGPDGKQYVLKRGADEGHLKEEMAADAAYRALGVAVPDSAGTTMGGKEVKLARFVEGRSLGDVLDDPDVSAAEKAAVKKEAGKHFVADALLGNWDAVGLDGDNMLVTEDGKVVRIDNGGSLRYRAQGAKKSPGQFGPAVTELESMRAGKLNPSAAGVFGGVTPAEVKAQIEDVVSKKDALLKALPPELRKTVGERVDYLAGQLHAPKAPDPGFTGTDALGREWVNGELVAAKDEPGKGKGKGGGDQPAPARPPRAPATKGTREAHEALDGVLEQIEGDPSFTGADAEDAVSDVVASLHNQKHSNEFLTQLGLPPGGSASGKVKKYLNDYAAAVRRSWPADGPADAGAADFPDEAGRKKINPAARIRLAKHADAVLGGLSKHDLASVQDYTGEAFIGVNSALRSGKPLSEDAEVVRKSLDDVFARTPPLDKPAVVYRVINLKKDDLARMLGDMDAATRGGEAYQFKEFLSTSIDPGIVSDFGLGQGKTPVVLEIKARHGLYVEGVTENPGEEEFLIPRGARFRVVAVTEGAHGKKGLNNKTVQLEQI